MGGVKEGGREGEWEEQRRGKGGWEGGMESKWDGWMERGQVDKWMWESEDGREGAMDGWVVGLDGEIPYYSKTNVPFCVHF